MVIDYLNRYALMDKLLKDGGLVIQTQVPALAALLLYSEFKEPIHSAEVIFGLQTHAGIDQTERKLLMEFKIAHLEQPVNAESVSTLGESEARSSEPKEITV